MNREETESEVVTETTEIVSVTIDEGETKEVDTNEIDTTTDERINMTGKEEMIVRELIMTDATIDVERKGIVVIVEKIGKIDLVSVTRVIEETER